MTKLAYCLPVLLLAACGTSEPTIDRVQKVPVYYSPPQELMVCPPPVELTDDLIESIQTEADYNEKVVLPLYQNNEECHSNMNKIREESEKHDLLNVAKEQPED